MGEEVAEIVVPVDMRTVREVLAVIVPKMEMDAILFVKFAVVLVSVQTFGVFLAKFKVTLEHA